MENKAVQQLRNIAKLRGVRSYYSLRKAELIDALTTTCPLLDPPVPVIQTPTLNPTPYIPPSVLKRIKTGVMTSIKIFADGVISLIPESIKKPVNDT